MAATLDRVLGLLSYLYPMTVLTYFVGCSLAAVATLQTTKGAEKQYRGTPSRRAIISIIALYLLSYVAQVVVLVADSAIHRHWPTSEHTVIRPVSCALVFSLLLSKTLQTQHPVWYPWYGSCVMAIFFEAAITGINFKIGFRDLKPYVQIVNLSLGAARTVFLAVLVLWFSVGRWALRLSDATDEERQGLLKDDDNADQEAQNGNANGYGTTQNNKKAEFGWERRHRQAKESMEARLIEKGNWFQYAKEFKLFIPYVWPFGNYVLQAKVAGVIVCLLVSNVLNLLLPRQTGIIMDSLAGHNSTSPWLAVFIFAMLRLLDSESGISLLRSSLWIHVQYYSREAISRAAYSHMMHLSADFHDSKNTSDLMMSLQGGSAISNTIENILLQAAPMLIDMFIATIYLSITFGPYQGLIVVATGGLFLVLTSRMVADTKEASRVRRNAMYSEYYVRHSGLTGWSTVSAFNQVGYEDNRHADAVATRWLRERQYMVSWYTSVAFQTLVLTSGLLASAFVAVWRIRDGAATPGSFAMLLMYWAQLTSPLKFFARLGKNMSDDFISAERLLVVMKAEPTVENKKNARPIKFTAGEVVFDKVGFSYDKQKQVLKDVSFEVPAGQTVAFVGATGAGKSTLLKLLDRFYDATEGCIRIDGQNIVDVDLFSLRDRIGVVPQSPILFDDTIMNNVRYGRITASDEEVFEACRAACMHDKILEFTDGYETRVGERGINLSGGELQRVAIARAILKQPDMVLLDEATSAVDTDTEQQIQASFKRLCEGRTTFIVAHRLSTIMNADRIIVVEGGQVIEQGSHDELLEAHGRYADLWAKQVFLRPKKQEEGLAIAVVNDLPQERAAEETSRAKEMATEAKAENANDDSAESNKLNPDAPTFTPKAGRKVGGTGTTESTEASQTTISTTPNTQS